MIGMLASVVGAYYYLRIIKIMWFDEPVGGFQPMAGELRLVLGLSGIFVLFYVLIGGLSGRWLALLPRPSSDGMGFQLAPTANAQGFRLEAHQAVGSTNAMALERAMAGDPASSGSSPRSRTAVAAGAAACGRRRKAISPRPCSRFSITICIMRRRSASLPAWRLQMRWMRWRPMPVFPSVSMAAVGRASSASS
ncbi:hypothetical protein GCM10023067_47650 [Aminobacter aganoensis]